MKIGSFFVAGFSGKTVPEWLKAAILQHDLFGVILFARNLGNVAQVRALCAELRALKRQVSPEPLLIGLDHEGGFVTRAQDLVPGFPPALAQATGGTPKATRELYRHAGAVMRELGMNCNFAPVFDLLPKRGASPIGIRSFGNNPETVGAFGVAAFQGARDAGILSCGKHFPGLGSARLDSHDTLPTVSRSKTLLASRDLLPFRKAVLAGIPMLMTAHAFYPAWETETIPATFSQKINREWLREKMHFQGVLVSDDLGMGAVAERFSLQESALTAIGSGVDLALACHAEEGLLRVFEALQGDFFEKVPESRLIESAQRKRALAKQIHAMELLPQVPIDDDSILKIRRRIAKKVFRVLKTGSRRLPGRNITVLALPGWIPKGVEEIPPALDRFVHAFHSRFPDSQSRILKDTEEMRKFAEEKTKNPILLLAKDLAADPSQRAFVEQLVRGSGKIACAVCVKNPEDIRFLKPFAHSLLCTLGFDKENRDAVLEFFAKA